MDIMINPFICIVDMMKMNMDINLVNVPLKAGDLKQDIPDPVPGS